MAMARLADPTIQLQIDEAILDYLMYAAITTQLQHIQSITTGDVGSDQAEVKSLLKLVNCEISITHSNVPWLSSCAFSVFSGLSLLASTSPW